MRPNHRTALLLLALTLPAAAHAAKAPGLRFSHDDWELACDNTRTCRAAGYHEEADDALPVSVLLTRPAGPGSAVKAELQLGGAEEEDFLPAGVTALVLTMRIDGKPLGKVRITRKDTIPELAPDQTRALLAALTKSSTIAWSDGTRTWRLSDKGASAVLLKMDDFQGRIGTPGALVRKGTTAESSVAPPLPAPVVVLAPVPLANQGAVTLPRAAMQNLRAALKASLKEGECDDLAAPEGEPDGITLEPLAQGKLLASTRCWRGAYNEGSGYWIVNARAPFAPQLVTSDASGYADGVIEAAQKGRGVGDCWSNRTWTWDGRRFVQTADATTGMCKSIAAGGAWSLPTLVTGLRAALPRRPRAGGGPSTSRHGKQTWVPASAGTTAGDGA